MPFLLAALAGFAFMPRRGRAAWLLLCSLLFYAEGPAWQAGVLVASTALDYGAGLALGRLEGCGLRAATLWVSVIGNLALLLGSKATGLMALGVSFYTFQSLSYTIDVFKGRLAPCRDPVAFFLYVAFFPQLAAGPIERARSLLPQIRGLGSSDARMFEARDLDAGARLILWGLFKKLCVADRLRPWTGAVVAAPEGSDWLTLTGALVSVSVTLYLDFSAYTDIARGAARWFGIDLVRNFRQPYYARSLGDLLQRWHMSLVDWIMDYVWAPIVGGRWTLPRLLLANSVTLGLFAAWHGLRPEMILFGSLLGPLLTVEQWRALQRRRRGERAPSRRGPRLHLVGRAVALTAWIGLSFALLSPDWASTVTFFDAFDAAASPSPEVLRTLWLVVPAAAIGLVIHGVAAWPGLERRWDSLPWPGRVLVFIGGVVLVAQTAVDGSGDFIYFRY